MYAWVFCRTLSMLHRSIAGDLSIPIAFIYQVILDSCYSLTYVLNVNMLYSGRVYHVIGRLTLPSLS